MTTTITKTAAIKAARRAVGQIIRRSSTDYVFLAPRNCNATAEHQASTYRQAVELRTQKIADMALSKMRHTMAVVEVGIDGTTIEQLVACGIRQAAANYPRFCA